MLVKEVAELTGVSVRTLHHYHAIGLLVPDAMTAAGYRLYSDENLKTLQQILFFRELDFSLSDIQEILESPDFNRQQMLEVQRQLLLEKRDRYTQIIQTIEQTIAAEKGGYAMTKEAQFKGFDFQKGKAYEVEAKEKYGDEAVERGNALFSGAGDKGEEMNEIYRHLAALRHLDPAPKEAQAGVEQWFDFLTVNFNFPPEGFASLGQSYIQDKRFTQNIDQFGEGLAQFMSEAMGIFGKEKL